MRCVKAFGCSLRAVMETEVSGQIGAGPYERSASSAPPTATATAPGRWDTRVGTIELKIPKVTAGAYFPSLLEPRRRAEKALHAVVVEAYVKGVSTRKVDDLVRALGMRRDQPRLRSRGSASPSRPRCRTFLGRPIESGVPVPLARRDLPQGSRGRSGDLGGDRGRDRGDRDRRAHGARSRDRVRARTTSSGWRSCASS